MICIDKPEGRTIEEAVTHLSGWYAAKKTPAVLKMLVGTSEFPVSRLDRPDVAAAYPGHYVFGFTGFLDISQYLPMRAAELKLSVVADGCEVDSTFLRVSPRALEEGATRYARQAEKGAWLRFALCCPACRAPRRISFSPPPHDFVGH
jgi:hypothetical protein